MYETAEMARQKKENRTCVILDVEEKVTVSIITPSRNC